MNYEYCIRCLDVNERKNLGRNIFYVLYMVYVNFWKSVLFLKIGDIEFWNLSSSIFFKKNF